MKFKFYLSSLTFLLATFLMVNAQTNTVTGKVTDGIDTLFGVNVIIQGTNTGVITDNNGEFSISSDKDLPWILEISSIGYTSQSIMVNSTHRQSHICLYLDPHQVFLYFFFFFLSFVFNLLINSRHENEDDFTE